MLQYDRGAPIRQAKVKKTMLSDANTSNFFENGDKML